MTDAAIIQLLLDRQEMGLSYLKSQYESYCMAIACRVLQSREDAEEVVSDVWLKLWDNIHRDQPRSLPAYLARVTRNLALDRYRQLTCDRRGGGEAALALEELSEVVGSSHDAENFLEAKELEAAINSFLGRLSRRDRGIFLRRYFYLETDEEIAQRYGLRTASVRTVISRTRKRLKTYLKKEGYL